MRLNQTAFLRLAWALHGLRLVPSLACAISLWQESVKYENGAKHTTAGKRRVRVPERSKDWLCQAERDLEEARWSMQGSFYEWACFTAQQAAEKAVKALYMHLHGEASGHFISKLLMALPESHKPPSDLIEKALLLDKLYIPPHYPNSFDSGGAQGLLPPEGRSGGAGLCGRGHQIL